MQRTHSHTQNRNSAPPVSTPVTKPLHIDDDHGRPAALAFVNFASVMRRQRVFSLSCRARVKAVSGEILWLWRARSRHTMISLLILRRFAAAACFRCAYRSSGMFLTVRVGIVRSLMTPLWNHHYGIIQPDWHVKPPGAAARRG